MRTVAILFALSAVVLAADANSRNFTGSFYIQMFDHYYPDYDKHYLTAGAIGTSEDRWGIVPFGFLPSQPWHVDRKGRLSVTGGGQTYYARAPVTADDDPILLLDTLKDYWDTPPFGVIEDHLAVNGENWNWYKCLNNYNDTALVDGRFGKPDNMGNFQDRYYFCSLVEVRAYIV